MHVAGPRYYGGLSSCKSEANLLHSSSQGHSQLPDVVKFDVNMIGSWMLITLFNLEQQTDIYMMTGQASRFLTVSFPENPADEP